MRPAEKNIRRLSPLLALVAVAMAVLTAAAGPFSQTVRVVRLNSAAQTQALAAEFSLIVNSAGWNDEQHKTPPPVTDSSKRAPEKAPQIIQPLSGYWDTVSAPLLPVADVAAHTELIAPLPRQIPVVHHHIIL